jgi:hypothetical protein
MGPDMRKVTPCAREGVGARAASAAVPAKPARAARRSMDLVMCVPPFVFFWVLFVGAMIYVFADDVNIAFATDWQRIPRGMAR